MNGNTRRARRKGNVVTLADIAAQAGVSTASVSRAMNSPDKVSDATRTRVLQTVAELNWVPSGAAKALATRQTRTIGAITATLGNANVAAELEALQRRLMDAGYVLLLACSGLNESNEIEQAKRLLERGVDALVLHHSSAHGREIWALVESLKVPTIVTRASEAVQGHTTVGYDGRKAFRRLTQHLIDLGHKRFGLMMIASPQVERRGTLDPDPRVGSAYAGVIEALHEVGLVIAPGHRTNTYFSIGKGRANFRKIMSTQPRPTALVCMNDQLAVGALFEAAAMGLRVPQDVSVVGFDDMELSALVTPPLTTMRTPDWEMGEVTAECVVDILSSRAPPVYRRELNLEFVLRSSTGPPPSASGEA